MIWRTMKRIALIASVVALMRVIQGQDGTVIQELHGSISTKEPKMWFDMRAGDTIQIHVTSDQFDPSSCVVSVVR